MQSSSLFKSPESWMVAFVVSMVILISISGIVTPVPMPTAHGPTPPRPPSAYSLEVFLDDESKLYSQFNEELLIRYFFDDERDGVYLDVGCAFPFKNSTTYYLEGHLGWTGIGVDAVKGYGPLWKENRPGAKFFHNAVSDTTGQSLTFYEAAYPIISSMYEDQVMKHAKKPPVPVKVETMTLNDLLDREKVDRIDFLSMDIEGAEPLALAGFDIERFAPKLVCIEIREGAENEQFIRNYFEEHHYEHIEAYMPHDFANWYYRPKNAG